MRPLSLLVSKPCRQRCVTFKDGGYPSGNVVTTTVGTFDGSHHNANTYHKLTPKALPNFYKFVRMLETSMSSMHTQDPLNILFMRGIQLES